MSAFDRHRLARKKKEKGGRSAHCLAGVFRFRDEEEEKKKTTRPVNERYAVDG